MIYLLTAAVLIVGYVVAQDPDCDYRQNIGANERYFINKNYSAGQTCRYILICPSGYNCRADCRLNMPSSTGCKDDRLLVSEIGEPTLTAAEAYCGRVTISVVSIDTTLVLGLLGNITSRGGTLSCNLTAQAVSVTPVPQCRCGERRQTRIVGGVNTGENEYTMMAGIMEKSIFHCGAVIISNNYVMTAGHCVHNKPAADVDVIVGVHDIENIPPGATYSIARIIIHERYNPDTYDYDIALIELKRFIQFSEKVLPVCLPFKFEGTNFTGRDVTILGFGTTFFGGPTSNMLLQAQVKVIDQNTCRSLGGNYVSARQVCSYAKGKDSCQFDSGGPLLYTDPTSGLLHTLGIISNGRMCGTGAGVNTRVTVQLSWIVNNAKTTFCIKR